MGVGIFDILNYSGFDSSQTGRTGGLGHLKGAQIFISWR